MANLNAWQRIDRVLQGQPFGNGQDGAYSSATIPTFTKDSCSGTSGTTTLTTAGSTFANGEVIMIHQSRGTGVGQWEINRVLSGGGTSTLTLYVALNYTYTDSGASQAQATKIPMYSSVTVQSGTWTIPSWDANKSGIAIIGCKSTFTVTGSIVGTGAGFAGGSANTTDRAGGFQGEGTSGAGSQTNTQNGNGGGGGQGNTGAGTQVSGAGGGNGGAGVGGSYQTGGDAVGTADLTTLDFGGGGGGGGTNSSGGGGERGGAGGAGGGILILFTKDIVINGSIACNGNNGSNTAGSSSGGGAGGGGGSILIGCQTATIGSNLMTATAGSGGTGGANGYNGGAGRIAIHHSGAVSGTSNPSFTDVTDITLVEQFGGSFIFGIM